MKGPARGMGRQSLTLTGELSCPLATDTNQKNADSAEWIIQNAKPWTLFSDTWNEEHEVRYVSLQICRLFHATVHTGIFELFDIEKQKELKLGYVESNPINYRILCKTIFCTGLNKEIAFLKLFIK